MPFFRKPVSIFPKIYLDISPECYNYGTDHQECIEHVLRYLKDSMENEPGRTWSTQMHTLLQEMIHYRNTLDEAGSEPDAAVVSKYEDRYREIMQKAKDEYEYEPPVKYNMNGYNLYKRLNEDMGSYTLFLHDMRVPATNNLSERSLRKYKRKQAQVMSFRSFDSIAYFCQGLGTLVMMKEHGEKNVFDSVAEIFDWRKNAGSYRLIKQSMLSALYLQVDPWTNVTKIVELAYAIGRSQQTIIKALR